MSVHLQVGGEFVCKTPVTHLSHYERCYCKNLPLASSRSDSFENSNISCNPLQISHISICTGAIKAVYCNHCLLVQITFTSTSPPANIPEVTLVCENGSSQGQEAGIRAKYCEPLFFPSPCHGGHGQEGQPRPGRHELCDRQAQQRRSDRRSRVSTHNVWDGVEHSFICEQV